MGKEYIQNKEGFDESIEALTNMLKADSDEKDLIKAKGSKDESDEEDDEDDEEEDYDEKYMKRNMKRYMKDNRDSVMKYMKKMGSVRKAVDFEVENSEPEIGDAEAVLIQGTDMFKASQEMAENFVEVLKGLIPEIKYLNQLQKAQGTVLLEMAEQVKEIGNAPQPRKSVVNAGETNLNKAIDTNVENPRLQKAIDYVKENTVGVLKSKILKAMGSGDQRAANAISQIESCGWDMRRLPSSTVNYIAELVSNEG